MLGQLVQQRPLHPAARDAGIILTDAVLDHLLQRGEIVGAELLGELVVDDGGSRLADLLDVDLEHGLLALELGGAVVLREGHGDGAVIARLRPDKLLFEGADEAVAAKLKPVILGIHARLRFAIEGAGEVDHQDVAVAGFTILGDGLAVTAALGTDGPVSHRPVCRPLRRRLAPARWWRNRPARCRAAARPPDRIPGCHPLRTR